MELRRTCVGVLLTAPISTRPIGALTTPPSKCSLITPLISKFGVAWVPRVLSRIICARAGNDTRNAKQEHNPKYLINRTRLTLGLMIPFSA
ncbi:MAG: hypothetical protein KME29_10640 [Calothrix sp. FI2-JRJ7]|nr:hypothetical protein [Calothrix sp. FI2-JRJ7]